MSEAGPDLNLEYDTGGRFRPLAVCKGRLFGSRGLNLYMLDESGAETMLISGAPTALRIASHAWGVERALRAGFHGACFRSPEELVVIARGRVLTVDVERSRVLGECRITRGSRPLKVAVGRDGRAYFGEYFGNSGRDQVRIFGSLDGRKWQVVYEFAPRVIRHVHSIRFDPFRGGFWVMTGDEREEAGIWFTDDGFASLRPIARGEQRYRAVTVIPVEDGLIVPTDTPHERNYIQHFDLGDLRWRRLEELPGSSMDSTEDGDIKLISTAVERSDVNTAQHVSVYASLNGLDWSRIACWERDLKWLRHLPPYFQHPNVFFADSDGSSNAVHAFPVGVKGLDGRMVSWARADIRELFESGRSTNNAG